MQQVLQVRTGITQQWHIKTQEICPVPPSSNLNCFSPQVMQKNDNLDHANLFHLAFLKAASVNKPLSNTGQPADTNPNALFNLAFLTPVDVYNPSPTQDHEAVTQTNEAQPIDNEAINRVFSQAVEKVYPPAPVVTTPVTNPVSTPAPTPNPTVLTEKRVDNKPASINNAQPKLTGTISSEKISLDNSENINPLYRTNENGYSQKQAEIEKNSTKTQLIDASPLEKKKSFKNSKILAPITNLIYPKK